MKLVVILGIEEYNDSLKEIFQKSEIPIYSQADIKGFKSQNSRENLSWFSNKNIAIYSNMTFAFIEENQTEKLMQYISEFNEKGKISNPFHAFQMNVEQFI